MSNAPITIRIRPGVERADDGRWRQICRVDTPDSTREYAGEWLEGPDAEQRAERDAKALAAQIRAAYNV